MLVITHYQRLLDYIRPDRVHVLAAGRIAASGGPELAHELEREGYDKYAPLRQGSGGQAERLSAKAAQGA
jgi:Fe-S cluster assembly ATP-binding protein